MANSMPFNSISKDRVYKAEDWAWYFSTFIGNGVFPNPSTGLQVVVDEDMTVTVKAGYAFINGYAFRNPSDYSITLETADGALSRIDRVVVRWDLTERDIYIKVLQGTVSASPTAAAITRDTEIYDLVLGDITVGKGVTSITTTNITDQRYDSDLCGIVTGVVEQIDASTLTAQFDAFFADYKANILTAYEEYLGWLAADQKTAAEALTEFENTLNSWTEAQQESFTEWLNNLKAILNEDVAGNLQLEIEELQNRAAELEKENADQSITIENLLGMLVSGTVTAVLTDSDGYVLTDSDGSALTAVHSYIKA